MLESFKSKFKEVFMEWQDTILIVGGLGEIKVYKIVESQREISKHEWKSVHHPELITDLDFIEAHKRLHEIVTDEAGRLGHDTLEELSIENTRREKILKDAANVIKQTIETLNPKNVMLSYTKEYINKLESYLDPKVKSKIKKIVPADLIKVPADKLLKHFS